MATSAIPGSNYPTVNDTDTIPTQRHDATLPTIPRSSISPEGEDDEDDDNARFTFPRPARDLWPNGERSLSGISLRAFLLGTILGITSTLTLISLLNGARTWRVPFFLSSLCLFHFLEFYITAKYNPPATKISSFLLSNGSGYAIAHSSATLEALVTTYFFPGWQARFAHPLVIGLGLVLLGTGQVVRSVAMAQAGTNFNHHVQTRRNVGHVLVKDGLYGVLRHPSYFGFFWWGLGTQIVLGNAFCFWVYAGVLWTFFSHRIFGEEKYLVHFFGREYEEYRKQTRVGIPFIP